MGGTESFPAGAGRYHGDHGHLPGVRNATRCDPRRAGLLDQLWHNGQTSTGIGALWTDWSFFTRPANKAKHVSVAAHSDGRMHAVMVGLDDQIWHNEQTSVGVSAAWTDWHVLSNVGNKAKVLALATHSDGRMHAVMVGLDGQIWHNEQTSVGVSAAWTDWHMLSNVGNKAKVLALAAHSDGRMHAVMVGLDDQIWHNEQTSVGVSAGWTDWHVLSNVGNKAKVLALAAHSDGRMHAVMVGLDDQIWHNEQTSVGVSAGWTDWHVLSSTGDKAKGLGVTRDGAGRLHAFAIGIGRSPWLATQQMLPERNMQPEAGGGRWYPTPLTLPDGRVVVMGGHPSKLDTRHSNFMVEIFNPQSNQWTDAGDEPLSVRNARPSLKPEIYPRLHVLPDGTVFCVVLADEKSYFWHPTQGFTLLPPSAVVPQEMRLSVNYDLNLWGSVLLPLRSTNAGYIARILVAGGMVQPYVIEPRAINPMWQPTQARQGFSGSPPVRRFASLVLLPDGTVLMVGGTQDWTDDQYAVLEAEQYDPLTNTWTKLAAAKRPRQYHSAALLLPDGRVWVGGSNKTEPPPSPNNGQVREDIMEVFSPPYLFRGPRPTIDSSPTDLFWNNNFLIRSQNAANITRVVLMRQGSSTHGFDADQRHVELEIQSRSVPQNTLVVKAPPNGNIAPPGYYMLFVLDSNDVPSHARMVHL